MRPLVIFVIHLLIVTMCKSQDPVDAAVKFINTLDASQKASAVYPFDAEERYGFHFFPADNRKGIPLDQLNETQKKAAGELIRACLHEQTVKKIYDIISLENVLKDLENRKADDHFRDPGKYFFTVFGVPGNNTIWGWRLEGHHVYFNFSVRENKLVAGTPGFLGANPAIVQQGPQKGKEVLKEEKDMGFVLLHALSPEQLKIAIIDSHAPAEIVTFIKRKAVIEHPAGLRYADMTSAQQQQLLQLLSLYVHRYSKLFADEMLKQIQQAGLNDLRFAWAGYTEPGEGKPHYYRIHGPTIIIEYDNTQNNANHVHTVVRDLQHDFGGDLLLEHYKASHQQQ